VVLQLQRPGADDVEVLKTELVQVQTLMDKLSLEREHQSDILQIERSNTEEKLCFAQVSHFIYALLLRCCCFCWAFEALLQMVILCTC